MERDRTLHFPFGVVRIAAAVLLGVTAISPAWSQPPTRPTAPPSAKPPIVRPPSKSGGAATANTNDIVAVVNQQPVTREELRRECIRRFGETVLESEVNKRLLLEACHQHGIRVTAEEVEAEVTRMANKFGVSVDRWLEMLQTEREVSPAQYRRDIVWPMLCLRRIAATRLEITQEELDRAFESEYGEMVQVRMIVSESPQRANELRTKAAAHPDQFDRLAKDYSEDPDSAAARGLIPPVRRHLGDPALEQAIFSLAEGEISAVEQVAGQYYLFKCEHRIPPRELTAEQRDRVMADLREVISDRKLREVGTKIFAQLQSQAKIVNVINDPKLSKEMPSVAAMVNDQPITLASLGDQCIIRYGEGVLQGEIDRRLLQQALKKRSLQITNGDLKQEMARAAVAFGFMKNDGTADLERWLQHITTESEVTVDTYTRDVVWPTVALKKLVGSTVIVTDEDLQKGFEANYGERVEVLAIVLSNQRTAHEVFDLARRNPTDKFFGELANQYSIETVSRANFGQVPPVRKWGGQPIIEQEAFRLKPGELSGVIVSGDKCIILRCLGRTTPVVQDMATVHDELEQDILEKKMRLAMNEEFDRLRANAQVDNFLNRSMQSARAPVQQATFQQ